jgi:hypothetical protein
MTPGLYQSAFHPLCKKDFLAPSHFSSQRATVCHDVTNLMTGIRGMGRPGSLRSSSRGINLSVEWFFGGYLAFEASFGVAGYDNCN